MLTEKGYREEACRLSWVFINKMGRMNQQEHFTYLAQTVTGHVFVDGVEVAETLAQAVYPQQGLMVMAEGCSVMADPQQVIEILIDDMKLNLPPLETRDASTDTELASRCLAESYENINEYLLDKPSGSSQPEQNCVALAAIQFVNNRLSCAVAGDYCCLSFGDDKIQTMNDIHDVNLKGDRALGLKTDFQMNITQHLISEGQIVLLAPLTLVQTVGEEHIRLTLSRFPDNLDMALRQINTRAAKRGMEAKPAIIIARVETALKSKPGWLNRLRKKPPK